MKYIFKFQRLPPKVCSGPQFLTTQILYISHILPNFVSENAAIDFAMGGAAVILMYVSNPGGCI